MANPKKSPKPTKNFGTKLKATLYANYKILLFMLSFFTLNLIFLAIAFVRYNVNPSEPFFIILTLLVLLINALLCWFIFLAKKRSWPIEKIFLIIGSTLGILYLFIIPIGRAPDEPTHYWKVYSIAQGNLLNETQDNIKGNYLPENIITTSNNFTDDAYEEIAQHLSEPVSKNQVFIKTLGSNPIDYTPHIIGITIGRILDLPAIIILYLGRLFGLASCIIIIYFCLRFIPILKKSLFFIACLPLSMQTFIAISYDGLIFCSAIALISFVLYSIHNTNLKLSIKHFLFLTLICMTLIAVKPVYFPLCFTLYFIPTQHFKDKKRKIVSITTILLASLALFFLWSSLSTVTEPGNGADTGGQISFILSNPIKYIVILVRNIFDMPFLYLARLGALEWLDTSTNQFYIIATLIFFIILCVKEHFTTSTIKLSKAFRWTIFLTSVATVVLTYTALYIQWTSVGSFDIEGVQTRYLLPVLIVIPLLCTPISYRRSTPSIKQFLPASYIYSFAIFLNINAITVLMCAHV